MFIQTESTPNPATSKFLPGPDDMGDGTVAAVPSKEQEHRTPRASDELPDGVRGADAGHWAGDGNPPAR